MTIKVIGKHGYWTVEYAKDSGGFAFDAIMLDDKQRNEAIQKGAKPQDVRGCSPSTTTSLFR